MSRQNKQKPKSNKQKPKKSFTRFMTSSVLAILVGSMGFTMLIFKTNTISKVTQEQKQQAAQWKTPLQFSVSTREKENEPPKTNLGGVSTGDPSITVPGVPSTTPEGNYSSGDIPAQVHVTDEDIAADIAAGIYTQEDYDYLVGLSGESGSYHGFYTVACCVRNRAVKGGITIRQAATAPGQFAGFKQSSVGNPDNQDIKDAAVAMLRGGPSNVGDCTFFFGRIDGYYMWAIPTVVEFYNVGNNIYYNTWGEVHNKNNSVDPNGIIIYDITTNSWVYPDGTGYHS